MPKVFFERENIQVEARAGQTLLEVAAERGISLFRGMWPELHCRRLPGWCNRCKVWVKQLEADAVNQPTSKELFPLRINGRVRGTMRLACQVELKGDVQVHTRIGGPIVQPNMTWKAATEPSRWKDRWEKRGEKATAADDGEADDDENTEKAPKKAAVGVAAAAKATAPTAPTAVTATAPLAPGAKVTPSGTAVITQSSSAAPMNSGAPPRLSSATLPTTPTPAARSALIPTAPIAANQPAAASPTAPPAPTATRPGVATPTTTPGTAGARPRVPTPTTTPGATATKSASTLPTPPTPSAPAAPAPGVSGPKPNADAPAPPATTTPTTKSG